MAPGLELRAVEILRHRGADASQRWTVGSGFAIGGRLVLTAAHNVGDGDLLVRVPDADGTEYVAQLIEPGDEDRGVDLALVEVTAAAWPTVPGLVRFAEVDRAAAARIDQSWAVGFPQFMEKPSASGTGVKLRDSVQVDGYVPAGSNLKSGRLQLNVTASPAGADSQWQGISGAVLFVNDSGLGDVAVGVVIEHHLPEGKSSLTVEPLTAFQRLDGDRQVAWRELLGINDRSPPVRLPRPAPLWATGQDPIGQAINLLVGDYRRVFAGRDRQLAALDALLDDDDTRHAFLHEPTGTGKTALLVRWVDQVRARRDRDVAFVPVSGRYNTAQQHEALGSLVLQLAAAYQQPLGETDVSPDRLRSLVGGYLRQRPPEDRRLLVVIDGIDEAIGWHPTRDMFPAKLPSGVTVVISARETAAKTRQQWVSQFGWEHASVAKVPTLQPLVDKDVKVVLQQLGQQGVQLTSNPTVVHEILRVSKGDPLTIRIIADELREGDISIERLSTRPAGLADYFQAALDEILDHSMDSAAVQDLLGLCATALGPINHSDLAALAPKTLGAKVARVATAKSVQRYLIGDGSADRGYVFGHPGLRELYAEELLDEDDVRGLHGRFVNYGRAWWLDRSKPLPGYLRRFWITHLAEVGEWPLARHVLVEIGDHDTQQPWAAARYAAEGSYAGYVADVDLLWTHAENVDDLATCFRCALVQTTIRSLSSNLPPDLLVALVTFGTTKGRWTLAAAVEHIRQIPDPAQQARALTKLVDATADEQWPWKLAVDTARAITDERGRAEVLRGLAPHLPPEQLAEALDAARAITTEWMRAEVLRGLAPHLAPEQLAEALDAARAITDERGRAEVLRGLAPHLAPEQLAEALDAARAITREETRADVLTGLASHLAPEQLAEALEAARAITDDSYRAEALAGLASHLAPEQLAEALDAARAITDEWSRAEALAGLAPHLAPEQLTEALEAARAITDERGRARMLTGLAPQLPPEQRSAGLQNALDAARSITPDFDYYRAEVLAELAPHLAPEQLAEALDAARAITSEWSRAEALAGLAPQLPAEQRSAVAQDALNASLAITDEGGRARVLAGLAPHLAPEQLAEALEAARAITDKRVRAKALTGLAPHVPPEQRSAVLQDALDAARAITRRPRRRTELPLHGREFGEKELRAEALRELAPHLAPEQRFAALQDALDAARAITDERGRARMLAGLASHLAPEQLAEALAAARVITDEEVRAEVLAGLAPHLSREHLAKALDAARAITNKALRAKALTGLAPQLPPGQRSAVAQEALSAGRAITDEEVRAEALMELAPHLPPGRRSAALQDALDTARAIIREETRAEALSELVPHLPPEQLAEALDAARAITNEALRAKVLREVVPHLPPEQLAEALEAARAIIDEEVRARMMAGLAPHLPSGQRSAVVQDALDSARAITREETRADVLTGLAPHLSPEQLAKALDAARAITDWHRAEALAGLAPHLPPEQLAEALDAARAITADYYRAKALAGLAPHLPPEQLAEALDAARAITDKQGRAKVMAGLAPHLPPEQLAEALDAARAITDDYYRAKALARLAPHLPPEQLAEALDAARAITDEWSRAEALRGLAPHLAPEQRSAAVQDALDAARAVISDAGRAEALTDLASHLAPEQLAEALDAARAITDKQGRAKVMAGLAPHLPPEQRSAAVQDALDAARAITREEVRAGALTDLASQLTPEQLAEALDAARAITREGRRAETLRGLASHLAPEQLAETLDAARAIIDGRVRAEALTGLAPHLTVHCERRPVPAVLFSQYELTLRSARTREVLLSAIASLGPWTRSLTADAALADVTYAITQISGLSW